MATTLLGGHVDWTCPNCNFTFSCDARDVTTRRRRSALIVAPNSPLPSPPRVLAGDRVLIDRTAFQVRRPRRWEVVAFHRPSGGQDLVVKRVVGLPGEGIRNHRRRHLRQRPDSAKDPAAAAGAANSRA